MAFGFSIRTWHRLACVVLIAATGCSTPLRHCTPPPTVTAREWNDLSAPPGAYARMDPGHVKQVMAQFADDPPRPYGPRYDALVLSGGGMYGSYSCGVLVGWSAAGTRPKFDCVTGVSTGALIATLAFLGPEYDETLRNFAITLSADKVYRTRRPHSIIWSNSVASSEPLEHLINDSCDANLLRAVAKVHAEGRRLFVGTTNLDARRLVVWDMGEIATRGDAEALTLFRKILLASCSIPGFLPPVTFDVEVDGRKYTELHVDGGASASLFLRLPELQIDKAIESRRRPLAGSNLYIIVAGKLYADSECVRPRVVSIAGSSLTSLLYSQARGDLYRLFTGALVTGIKYQMTAVPQDFAVNPDSTTFDLTEMRRLYDEGYRIGSSPNPWRNTPPGPEDAEQSVPRAGLKFTTADPEPVKK